MNSPLSQRLQQARERLFVGRAAQIDEFARALRGDSWPFAVWHLHGLGGIGKTTLLRQWKRQAQDAGAMVISLDGRDFEPNEGAFCQALGTALRESSREISHLESVAHPTPRALCEALAELPLRVILQIDTVELLAALDHFWREKFLPLLPENTVLMLAGREPLPLSWRGDAALWSEVASFNLDAFSRAESQNYLEKRGIDAPFWAQLLEWTHGHPLALSLAADVWQQHANAVGRAASENLLTGQTPENQTPEKAPEFSPAAAPDAAPAPVDLPQLVGPLLEHLVREVPTPAHRAALEICAIVRTLTEELLAEMLLGAGLDNADSDGFNADGFDSNGFDSNGFDSNGFDANGFNSNGAALNGADSERAGVPPDCHAIFEWLRGLSIVQTQRFGIFPHDIARELLVTDLLFRTPNWHRELHRRARQHYLRRIQNEGGAAQERAIFNCIYLHRLSPVVGPYLRWNDSGLALEIARPDDFSALLEMVERHEGAASRALAEMYFAAQPENVIVVRQPGGCAQGFVFQLAIERAGAAIFESDQGARRARDFLSANAPLRAGETATLFRFWMDRDNYQSVGATQSLIFVQAVRHYMITPQLAFTFFACAAPDFWRDGFAYADLERVPAADFSVENRTGETRSFGVFGHDWRARPVASWLDLLSQREIQLVSPPSETAPDATRPAFEALEPAQWLAAIHHALRNYGDAAALRRCRLLDTALIHRRARHIARGRTASTAPPKSEPTPDERVAALRLVLAEAMTALGAAPRLAKEHRALELCFVRGALTQHAAAAAMDVSHSSLRRYLHGGLLFVSSRLQEQENSADGSARNDYNFRGGKNEPRSNTF